MLVYRVIDNKYSNIKEIAKSYFQISDRLLLKLRKNNRIFLNDNLAKVNENVCINDIVKFDIEFEEESENIVATKEKLDIIFEDDYLLIVNKKTNIPVHPSISHYTDSLSNIVKYYFDSKNIKKKIRPVNRLDKDTSGIVIFAKNEYIQEALVRQMKAKVFKKEYLAILEGKLSNVSGTINAPIARKEGSIIEREINEDGVCSITHYKVLNEYIINDSCNQPTTLSLVRFYLETGRTHQIRVHSKYIGNPILGDTLYNKASNLISRQALHACKIEFIHPITKENLSFEINLPEDMKKICIK